jgi:hypothetical protein
LVSGEHGCAGGGNKLPLRTEGETDNVGMTRFYDCGIASLDGVYGLEQGNKEASMRFGNARELEDEIAVQ